LINKRVRGFLRLRSSIDKVSNSYADIRTVLVPGVRICEIVVLEAGGTTVPTTAVWRQDRTSDTRYRVTQSLQNIDCPHILSMIYPAHTKKQLKNESYTSPYRSNKVNSIIHKPTRSLPSFSSLFLNLIFPKASIQPTLHLPSTNLASLPRVKNPLHCRPPSRSRKHHKLPARPPSLDTGYR
jgi:hypothetical protein